MTRKVFIFLICVAMIFSVITTPALADEREITVIYNGQKLEFDVQPVLINSRTMVPMRAIFEALQATVYWSDFNETVVGVSLSGDRIVIPIGSTTATINDKPIQIDSPPVLMNGRTLVPLRFVSEALKCEVLWDDATYTVTINNENGNQKEVLFFDTTSYASLGTWTDIGNQILRAKTDGTPTNNPDDDAVSNFRVNSTGTYKIWVNSIDYELDQQGSRFYNVDINGNRLAKTFGQHGATGFVWEDGGTFELQKGVLNELRVVDTAAFFGRLNGLIITNDMEFTPTTDLASYKDYTVNNASATEFVPASFPEWANGDINETQVETIENDTFKINFYKGSAPRGGVVQNEIFMKRNGEWTLVKDRTEDLGVLAMRASRSRIMDEKPIRFDATSTAFDYYDQSFDTFEGEYSNPLIREYYKSATPEWLIPNSLEKVDDKTVRMGVSSEHVSGTLTFTLDELSDDPKVTFSANIKDDGAYSFSYFSGNDFSDESFERVTAPFNFIQDEIPADSSVLAESAMFTPMVTFTFDNDGKKFTKGVAVDPTSIREYVARLADRDFGLTFRSPDGNARGQLIAPTFGTHQCQFKAGDYYSFSYRIIYRDATGYETLKHIATNLYNCVDLRENHYASMNETIYNMTDLIMDDVYSGWDEKQMGFMDTEGDGTAAHSNFMAMVSQYLLTENEELLDKRVIPTVAFSLTRGRINYQRHVENPYPLGVIAPFSGGSFVGMYQASQGRMPYLLNVALDRNNAEKKLTQGGTNYQAMNQLTNSDNYINDIINIADAYYGDLFGGDFQAVTPFVHEAVNKNLNLFIRAYEETKDEKYLKAATKVGEYIMQQIWTTGYQNDYATTDYTVDPEYTTNLYMRNDNEEWGFAWKLGQRWRIGNPVGTWAPGKDLQNKIVEESAPGWVPARTGMGTEHPMSPDGSKVVFMNNWAGTMLKLAKYSGDEFFATQARNAMLGRSANYPGYYNDRLSLHDKRVEFPYEGPDFNVIFWHQIPSYLSLVEDFLITDAWYRSDMKIDFPSVVNSGYAYFDNNDYGFAPGKFYDEDDMWLWLDRGIIEPDSVKVNYVTAKKDGVLGIALMNTDDLDLTTTITLGEKIPNGSSHNEKAILIDANGKKSTVDVVNGEFTVTIPAKGIMSVIMHPEVKKPSWVKDYVISNNLGNTISSFDDGKAYLLQFNDDNYYAYLCSYKTAKEVKSVTYEYTYAGQTRTETITEFPYEIIVKVPTNIGFEYKVTAEGINGEKLDLGKGKLSPLTEEQQAVPFDGNKTQESVKINLQYFEPKTVSIKGMGVSNKKIRLVVDNAELGFAGKLENDVLNGARLKSVWTHNATGEKHLLDSTIIDTEAGAGSTVLVLNPYGAIQVDSITTTTYRIDTAMILHPDTDASKYKLDGEDKAVTMLITEKRKPLPDYFEPFSLSPDPGDWGSQSGNFRFYLPISRFPFEVYEDGLKRCNVKLVTTEAATGKVEIHYTKVVANEMRGAETVVVVPRPQTISKDRETILTNGIYSGFELTFSAPDPLDFN